MDAAAAVRCLEDARAHALSPAGRWPGWDFDAHPLAMVVDEGTLLWRHPQPPGGFRPWREPHTHMGPALELANSWAELGDRVCATARLDGGYATPAQAPRILLHEAFHVFQHQLRPDSGVPFARTAFYPELDAANNALARAENLALAAFLEGSRGAAEAAEDVLALRATRYACVEPEWEAYEAACEWCEGGAQLAETLAFDGGARSDLAATLWRSNKAGSGAAYARFYASGAALGLLSAALSPTDARARWLAGTPLDGLASVASAGDARAALARWDVSTLLADEAEASRRRRAAADAVVGRMAPTLTVAFGAAPPFRRSFNAQRLQVVGGGRRIHWGLLRLEGPGWSFHVPEGPVLEDLVAERLVMRRPDGLALDLGTGPLETTLLRASRATVGPAGRVAVLPPRG